MQIDSLTVGRQRLRSTIKAEPIPIRWEPSLPVFAKEEFLRAVGDEYGWLGGMDEAGELRCFLPYTIIRKAGLRLVRFRMETISCGAGVTIEEEKSFLNSVVEYFRKIRADVIIPPSNNAIFRTYPDGAEAAPYGTFVIDLQQSEEALWRGVSRITRQNIGTAKRDGVLVKEGSELLEPAYRLIHETFGRSQMRFMSRPAFAGFVAGLGEHARLFVAQYSGMPQTYCLFGFSSSCAYAIYAGNVERQHQGANKLLYWEAIRFFRSLGILKFDFLGARLNPPQGSKQEAINQMKRRFGATLLEGYLWKYALRPSRSWIYSTGVRWMRGGDIVDQETKRLGNPGLHADKRVEG